MRLVTILLCVLIVLFVVRQYVAAATAAARRQRTDVIRKEVRCMFVSEFVRLIDGGGGITGLGRCLLVY